MIYRDPLGNPVPDATVAWTPGPVSQVRTADGWQTVAAPARWTLQAVAEAQYSAIGGEDDEAAIVADLVVAGWVVTGRSRDRRGYSVLQVRHVETGAEADRIAAERDALAAQATTPCYVRFGAAPESGRSRNCRDNLAEPGVSVFRARRGRGVLVIELSTNDETGSLLALQGRPIYLATGTEAGTGSDGEPCLTAVSCRRIYPKALLFLRP